MRSDLRLHTSHSEVNKNINLGYSQDQGYSYSVKVRVCFMGNLGLLDFKSVGISYSYIHEPNMRECFEMCIVQSTFSISVVAGLKHEPIAQF